jgi:hypothetical protein
LLIIKTMEDITEILKKAKSLQADLQKEAFVPAEDPAQGGAAPQGGAPMPPQGGGQPPAGGQYPPELLQVAQQLGLPIDPQSGMPLDPETGQPIPPEVMAQVAQQMQAQGGGAPAPQGGAPAGAPPPADPAAQGGQPPAQQAPSQSPEMQQVMMAVEQMGQALEAVTAENEELKKQIMDFNARVAEMDGKMQIVMQELSRPVPPM